MLAGELVSAWDYVTRQLRGIRGEELDSALIRGSYPGRVDKSSDGATYYYFCMRIKLSFLESASTASENRVVSLHYLSAVIQQHCAALCPMRDRLPQQHCFRQQIIGHTMF